MKEDTAVKAAAVQVVTGTCGAVAPQLAPAHSGNNIRGLCPEDPRMLHRTLNVTVTTSPTSNVHGDIKQR